jgi:hypothetical protein
MTAIARNLVEVGEIARMLNARVRELAPAVLPGGRRDGHEWRAGSLAGERGDSLAVHLVGAKAGIWCDFATGETGDALDLIAQSRYGSDKRQALAWAKSWLGLEGADPTRLAAARAAVPDGAALDRQAEEEAAATRSTALRLWLGACAVVRGTPVDRYLTSRGISLAALGRQPRALRYHPQLWHVPSRRHWPAMLSLITAPDGSAAAVHRTWLEERADGSVAKAPVERNKAVLGGYRGCAIRLWRGASGKPFREMAPDETIDITEGIEDGLSVAYACPEFRVIAAISLSNMGTVELPPAARTVRLWRQNDSKPAPIAAFNRALEAHFGAGRQVLVPEIPASMKDVNDLVCADA